MVNLFHQIDANTENRWEPTDFGIQPALYHR